MEPGIFRTLEQERIKQEMIITSQTIGAGKKRSTVYTICTTPAENGNSYPHEVCRFDTMEAAALALRYLSGAALDAEDTARAREILHSVDAKGTAE